MKNLPKDIRLTDELERTLMAQAMDEQLRFKPGVALLNVWEKLSALFDAGKVSKHPDTVNSAG